jgi:hypothetical protein
VGDKIVVMVEIPKPKAETDNPDWTEEQDTEWGKKVDSQVSPGAARRSLGFVDPRPAKAMFPSRKPGEVQGSHPDEAGDARRISTTGGLEAVNASEEEKARQREEVERAKRIIFGGQTPEEKNSNN